MEEVTRVKFYSANKVQPLTNYHVYALQGITSHEGKDCWKRVDGKNEDREFTMRE